jgi:hypothetical protein
MTSEFPAYGQQRTMVLSGGLDEDGRLRENPSEPVWNVLRIEGPLDAARLGRAVAAVTASVDALTLRLRNTERGPVQVFGVPDPIALEVVGAEPVEQDGELPADLAGVLAPLLFDKIDLRHRQAGRICLVTGGGDEHLLALSFDHSTLDAWALGLLVKAIAHCYRTDGQLPVQARGFRDFLGTLPAAGVQEESLGAWRELLAGHPLPGPALHFPGGRAKPHEEYRIDGYFDQSLPRSMADDLTAAAGELGLTRAGLLAAATGLAVTAWSDGPQPMLGLRHGRRRREDTLVTGPLLEPYVALPPAPDGPEPKTVREWLLAHQAANADTPPLYGRSIREVTPLAPRNVAFNVIPPARAVPLGPATRAVTADKDFLAPLWAGGRPTVPSTAAMWINFYLDRPGAVDVLITHDTEVLPDPGVLTRTVRSVVALAAHDRDAPLAAVRSHANDRYEKGNQ